MASFIISIVLFIAGITGLIVTKKKLAVGQGKSL